MNRSYLAGATALLAVATAAPARAGYVSDPISLRNYNLMVVNNLTSSSEVDGQTAVGGGILGGQSQYGGHLGGVASNHATVVIGGNVNVQNQVTVQTGTLAAGGSVAGGSVIDNGGQAPTYNVSGLTNLGSQISSYLDPISSSFASHSAPSGNQVILSGNTLNFNVGSVDSNGVAYLTVAGSQFNSSVGQMSLNLNNGLSFNGNLTVVINVTNAPGSAINITNGNFIGGFTQANAPNILWNFSQETGALNISQQMFGSILAPYATLTNSTAINGSVFVGSFTQNGEVHLGGSGENLGYQGFIPATVPEPSSWALMGAGAVGLLGYRWRRRMARRSS